MAFRLLDSVQQTTSTTGTGTYTIDGTVDGMRTIAGAGASNGDTFPYMVKDGTNYECGIGTYASSGTTVARTTILYSSNGGSAVNWAAGDKTFFVGLPSAFLVLNAVRHKLDATTAPTVNDDVTDQYGPGSFWVDVTNDKVYICLDGTNGAAIWRLVIQTPNIAVATSTPSTAPSVTGNGILAVGDASSATGDYAVALGRNADATAANTIAIGENNAISGAGSIGIGKGFTVSNARGVFLGAGTLTSLYDGTVAIGDFTGDSTDRTVVINCRSPNFGEGGILIGGHANNASDLGACIGGQNNFVGSGCIGSLAIGKYAGAYDPATFVIGGGGSANDSYANALQAAQSATTTNGTARKMSFDDDHGAHGGFFCDAGASAFHILVAAFEEATGDVKCWTIKVLVKTLADYSATSIVGSPTITADFSSGAGAAAWDVDVGVDSADNELYIEVTGEAAKTITWAASLVAAQAVAY